MASSPLIIAGMHRSGTSLLARLLSESGVWLGADKESKHLESLFFLEINDSLLSLTDSTWHRPESFLKSLENRQQRVIYRNTAVRACRSSLAVRYLGLGRWKHGGLFEQTRLWGWKDPRNSLTLPVWLQIFPRARVLHIVRNGIDVANSLLLREERARHTRRGDSLWLRSGRALDRLVRLRGPEWNPGGDAMEEGFQLWSTHLGAVLEATKTLPENRCVTVQFERLMEEPIDQLLRLTHFLNLSIPDEELEKLSKSLRNDRSRAFLRDEGLVSFFERHRTHPMMRQFGYDEA